mmetsp:Transcript_66498/g.121185  ORF Transcript_66498/g.121185 Transcript_66498/m.121185 type:complete len:134 (-) Transcript_66498:99-500(-)
MDLTSFSGVVAIQMRLDGWFQVTILFMLLIRSIVLRYARVRHLMGQTLSSGPAMMVHHSSGVWYKTASGTKLSRATAFLCGRVEQVTGPISSSGLAMTTITPYQKTSSESIFAGSCRIQTRCELEIHILNSFE